VLDHWRRQVQFDSSYISVWDSLDGHRLIAVRGTKGTALDISEDILIGLTGSPTDLIGRQLLDILAATPESMVVDLASHSLGSSLALQAFSKNSIIKNRIHETYMFDPAYSPIARGVSESYERDATVRYFVNLNDIVSMGSLGHRAPRNVVFRSEGGPLTAHQLAQWQGSGVHTPQYHSPPESRVQAHKQVYPRGIAADDFTGEPPVYTREQLLANTILVSETTKDVGPAPSEVEPAASAVPFDFGSFENFDFDAL